MRDYNSNEKGQAMVETLVASLAFIPLLIAIPHIGKVLDIKHANIQQTRVDAFEQTLGPNTRSEPYEVLTDSLWVDHHGATMVTSSGIRVQQQSTALNRGVGMTALINGSVPVSPFESTGLDVNDQGIAVVTSNKQSNNLTQITHRGVSTVVHEGNTGMVNFENTLAVLSGTWSPPSEAVLKARVAGLTLDRTLHTHIMPGCGIWGGGPSYAAPSPFYEGKTCFETDLETRSDVVLDVHLELSDNGVN